jgi:2'-5' RNA ligase
MADGIYLFAEVPDPLGARIAQVQRAHDPRLAALFPPHITLVGSSGAGPIVPGALPEHEIAARLAAVTDRTAPLTLTFGAPVRFPQRDIVALPLSPHGPLRALHEALAAAAPTTPARYPFTPHCTLTMFPELTRERERALLALRFSDPFTLATLRVYHTREPQPARWLFDLPLRG